jgi:carbon-monoxide dehydrogenase medium subunit
MSGAKIDNAAIGITGVSAIAYRATAVEKALRGKSAGEFASAAAQAGANVEFIGDTYASSEYRQHLVTVMTRRALDEAMSKK